MNHTIALSPDNWQFSGFAFPTTTPVPDQLFDELLHRLSGAELKVLMYIIRRTYGFKKQSDDISLAQLVNGIKSKSGKVLDQGTGLGKSSVARALNSLEEKNIILRTRRRSEVKGDQATTYMLNIQTPVSQNGTGGVSLARQGVSQQRDTQQTVRQETVRQQHREVRNLGTSASGNRELAAVLMEKGIEQNVAQYFASKYSQQRIEDNLDWFEWKQKNEPNSIKTNPAGLLRRAIEQDYASEGYHKGFQTRQQKAVVATKRKKALAEQERLIDQRKREQAASLQQKEKERVKRLEKLRERYHSTAKDRKLWQQVLKSLRKELTTLKFNTYLAQSELLSVQEDKAIIVVPTPFIKAWIEDHLAHPIQEVLGRNLRDRTIIPKIIALSQINE